MDEGPQPVGGTRKSLAERRSVELTKLFDLVRSNRARPESLDDSSGPNGDPDLDFDYGDSDSYANELAELFGYSELEEFSSNAEAYLEYSLRRQLPKEWVDLEEEHRKTIVLDLIEELELSDSEKRMRAVRTFLYLLQGCFLECRNEAECLQMCVKNAYLLYDLGVFYALCTVLSIELGPLGQQEKTAEDHHQQSHQQLLLSYKQINKSTTGEVEDGKSEGGGGKRKSVCMGDNTNLRIILSALYMVMEALRREGVGGICSFTALSESEFGKMKKLRERFQSDLGMPLCGDQLLAVVLFQMVTKFCAGTHPYYPMRKVLLLLWKTLLAWLGGWEELKKMKTEARAKAGLSPCEDTLTVAQTMRAAAPPSVLPLVTAAVGGDSDVSMGLRRGRPPLARRQMACRRSSDTDNEDCDDQLDMSEPSGGLPESESGDDSPFEPPKESIPDDPKPSEPELSLQNGMATPRPGSPKNVPKVPPPVPSGRFLVNERTAGHKTLPWLPKIRPQEVEAFLEHERNKFFGYVLPNDGHTTAGLPQPILDSLKALKKHVYVSLGEIQAKREEDLNRYFFSQKEGEIGDTGVEELYRCLLPEIPQHMIAMLKILLSAQPSSKAKTDAINILSDVLPLGTDPALTSSSTSLSRELGDCRSTGIEESLRTSIDISRHKEVIVKAASSILLLLLKHTRLNHIYQFEYISQHLVFANCIPLILKFFDQNILQYVQSRNELWAWNFPGCVIYYGQHDHLWPELNLENLESKDTNGNETPQRSRPGGYFLWRNLFAAINLLRILNKLTKWKHARTMMLVVFKSAPIMKRALRVKQALLQLYALKLLKMQAKHLGRQWRKTNMEIMSAIYSKVRHRLNDDWAYGNETQSKAFDFQSEESSLRDAIEKFHMRRYGQGLTSSTASSMTGSGNEGAQDGGTSGNSNSVSSERWIFNDPDFLPYDNNVVSVLGVEYELTDRFKVNYQKWLEREVYNAGIDWDQVLALNRNKK